MAGKVELFFPKLTQEVKWGNQGKHMDFMVPSSVL